MVSKKEEEKGKVQLVWAIQRSEREFANGDWNEEKCGLLFKENWYWNKQIRHCYLGIIWTSILAI